MGLSHEAARMATENATNAKMASNAERRAELAERLLSVARQALDDMNQSATIYNFGGKDNTYNEVTVSRPPTGDQRNLMTVAAIAIDKHVVLERIDSARSGAVQVDLFIQALSGAGE